ncbi:MAG: hypothetical protein KAG53_10485 [Endozoicomonadaceae bacterium]|nr:hypothetical protein [Endozoicomonadaceae bacterium]
MNDSMVLSVKASVSHAWNHSQGCAAVFHVIKAFFSGLLRTYTVTVNDAVNCYINDKDHRDSLFIKEFRQVPLFMKKIINATEAEVESSTKNKKVVTFYSETDADALQGSKQFGSVHDADALQGSK